MSKTARVLWSIVRILLLAIAGFYALVLLYFGLSQGRFIYFPEPEITATPADIDLQYEDLILTTSDGLRLSAWYIPAIDARGTVLFCHGNAGNISSRLETIRIYNKLGLNMLVFDYRGFGQSEGKPTESGTYLDTDAAFDYLVENKGLSHDGIILLGRSLGGAMVVDIARRRSPKALIVESSFTSIPDLAGEMYPFLPVKLISQFKYNSLARIAEIECPVLVIHSPDDLVIPFEHGKLLFEAASARKQFLEISGSHNDGFIVSGKTYEDGIDRFLSTIGSVTPDSGSAMADSGKVSTTFADSVD